MYRNNQVIPRNLNVNVNNNSNSSNNNNSNNTNQLVTVNTNNSNNNSKSKCACGFNDPSVFPENYMYGQSYVPIQFIDTTFKPEVGLKMGTLFPELVSPYEPCQNMREIAYLREVTGNEGKCPNETTNS